MKAIVRYSAILVVLTLVSLLPAFEAYGVEERVIFSSHRIYDGTPGDKLRSAAFSGDLRSIQRLIAKGADINSADRDGWTPLVWAQLGDQPEAVKLLIEKGAAINAKDKAGNTVLAHAAMAGRVEIVEVLLAQGAEVETRNRRGWTPLMEASFHGRAEEAELLLAKGADPNSTNRKGHSALSLAQATENMHVAALLVANGADPDLQTKKFLAHMGNGSSKAGGPVRVRLAGLLRNREAVQSVCRECRSRQASTLQNGIVRDGYGTTVALERMCHLDLSRDAGRTHGQLAGGPFGPRTSSGVLGKNSGLAGAEGILSEALMTWQEIRSQYPELGKHFEKMINRDGLISGNSRIEPLVSRAMGAWQRLQQENPDLALQLMNLAGIGR